jgi:hypothetical protein
MWQCCYRFLASLAIENEICLEQEGAERQLLYATCNHSDGFRMTIEEFYKIQEDLSKHFSVIHNMQITSEDIFWALFIVLGDAESLEFATDIWDLDLDYEHCFEALSKFDFGLLRVEIASKEGIVPKRFLLQYKVRVKFKGQTWVIHRYDADPFPSNPHAHCLDQNIKLDLSTGGFYRKRQLMGKIKAKDLMQIRELAAKVYKGELPPMLAEA